MNFLKLYIKQLFKNANNIFEFFDIIICSLIYGTSPVNYSLFQFSKLKHSQRKTYITNRISRNIIKKYNSPAKIDEFENKAKFAENFSEFFGRKWIVTNNMSQKDFNGFLCTVNKFICKPSNGAQGQDIEVFENLNQKDSELLYNKLVNDYKNCIIEEWIEQHQDISSLYPDAVNCLRLITILNNGNVHIITGGLTLGYDGKIANGSQKSIICPIDLNTGILNKPGADAYGNIYEIHPVTKAKIIGFQVPFWKEILLLLEKAAKTIPEIGYVGWDIAITPNGPILIEGNTTPGYKYYQLPVHMENGFGNLASYKEFL